MVPLWQEDSALEMPEMQASQEARLLHAQQQPQGHRLADKWLQCEKKDEADPRKAGESSGLHSQTEPADSCSVRAPAVSERSMPGCKAKEDMLRQCRLGAWLAVIFSGYGLQRGWCACGIPYDCQQKVDYLTVFQDLTKLAFFGGALAWFCRITEPQRFLWLFSWWRWYVWTVYLVLPPAYSGISNASFARESFHTLSDWGPAMIALASAAAALLLAAVCMHVWLAVRGGGCAGLAAYALPRLAVYAFVAISAAVLTSAWLATLHVHHLYLGWAAALLAEFDHWASGLVLGAGTAVLVQGAGAYTFEPLFESTRCFLTASVDHVACAFWDPVVENKQPFQLNICATEGNALPAADCGLWP